MTSIDDINCSILRAFGLDNNDIAKIAGEVCIRLNHDQFPRIELSMYPKPVKDLTTWDLVEIDGERYLLVGDRTFKLVPADE